MLLYHPVGDANHCIYRLISILEGVKQNKAQLTSLQLADFFYLFPEQLKKIEKWPRSNSRSKQIITSIPSSYEIIENPRRVFYDLREVQKGAIMHLKSKGVIKVQNRSISLNLENIPQPISEALKIDPFRASEIFKIITTEFIIQNTFGSNGMKKRTGLMEFHYD